MMSFITKYICPRKHIKICDLDYVYTLDQFKYFIKTNPVQLYEQMINEDKGFKIFISEYDETEPISRVFNVGNHKYSMELDILRLQQQWQRTASLESKIAELECRLNISNGGVWIHDGRSQVRDV